MKKNVGRITFAALISLIAISSTSSSVFAARTPDNQDATLTSQIPVTDDLVFNNAVCSLPSAPDLTATYASYVLDTTKYNPYSNSTSTINAVKASYQAAINDTINGTWFVSYGRNNNGEFVRIAWTRDPNAYLHWQSNPSATYDHQQVNLISNGTGSGEARIQCDSARHFFGVRTAHTGATNSNLTFQGHNFYTTALFYLYSSNSSFAYNYPAGYSGLPMPDQSTDSDGDGLTVAQETAQGTIDTQIDTDGDGLDDYLESPWNSDRDDIFCGVLQCAYPDPTVKDIYVEIDWMKDSSNNLYKPSSTQLGLVEDMFDDKGINFHADTGQFGGGNELATYTQTLPYTVTPGQIDFWDYRDGGDGITANFSSDRDLIWRYMIFGYNYAEATGSSGWAETMGDDLFISGGLIENMSGLASLDRAIAGTMAHEIGHGLCLSDEQFYVEQPTECAFSGIDNDTYKPQNYESVMNYRYQLTDDDDMGVVDYSDGSNVSDDHDDWSAVTLGMGGFSGTHTVLGAEEKIANDSYVSPKGNVYSVSPDGSIITEEAPMAEAIENNERQSQEEAQVQGQNDNELPTGLSQSVESDSVSKRLAGESSDNSPFDWTALLGGGATLAVIALGATWYHIVRR